MTDPAETLIIVTSDHDHRLPPLNRVPRGAPVAGLAGWDPAAHPPPLERPPGRGTGPVQVGFSQVGPGAPAPTAPDTLPAGGHGTADVAIHARGPLAGLFAGTVEQNYIFHVMHRALALGGDD
jgi:alkaline phosphatase